MGAKTEPNQQQNTPKNSPKRPQNQAKSTNPAPPQSHHNPWLQADRIHLAIPGIKAVVTSTRRTVPIFDKLFKNKHNLRILYVYFQGGDSTSWSLHIWSQKRFGSLWEFSGH